MPKLRDSFGDVLVFVLGASLIATLTVIGLIETEKGKLRADIEAKGKELIKAQCRVAELEGEKEGREAESMLIEAWQGLASYYAEPYHGRPTSSGEIFDKRAFTTATVNIPLGVNLLVLDLERHTWTFVRNNDRMPAYHGRLTDLSEAAGEQLGMIERGVVPVMMITMRPRPSGGD